MTSTNDEKEVKSNQTSGPRGKTYFIELYKSLESRLSEGGSPHERTTNLCEAWRRVHSLCQHSAPSTHPHLLSWLQRHTARAVLQTKWQSPERREDRALLEEAINVFIVESRAAADVRDGVSPPWEAQLVARGQWFKRVLDNPWKHPVLNCLLNPDGTPPTDDEVIEWLKEERGVTFVMRLHTLVAEKCDDIAMSLATAVMERVRGDSAPVSDLQLADEPKDKSEKTSPNFGDRLRTEAGFTVDVWELLTDIEFVLLHKRDSSKCIDLAKQMPLRGAYQLIERLQSRLETSPREKRLWKNSKEVAVLLAQVVIARCMVVPECGGAARSALYCCARSLARLVDGARLPAAACALAAPAPTAKHLHTLAAAIDAQLAQKNETSMKPFVCELYVRAITAGMNELERLKLKTEKDTEARLMEQTLSSWFVQLGAVLAHSDRVKCECALTAFSVHPSPHMYERIKAAPDLPVVQLDTEDSCESTQATNAEFGSWASDSRSMTNFVKTSQTLNMKARQNQANVLSTAILNEGEALGLSPELCQDITVLLSGPRVKTLSWDMDRELLLENCRAYMERTHGGTRALTTDLKYLNLNPADFQHLPEEDDDDTNIYYGIEKGYEHLVEFQEPEDIWEDAFQDLGKAQTSSSEEYEEVKPQRKKKQKRIVPETRTGPTPTISDNDSDPLSFVAEAKRSEKKERPLGKERSHKKKKEKGPAVDPLEIGEGAEKKPKEKKERKKKEKPTKPQEETFGSLSSLVGLKVAKKKRPSKVPVTDSDRDTRGMSTTSEGASFVKSRNSSQSSDSMSFMIESMTDGRGVQGQNNQFNRPHRRPGVGSIPTQTPTDRSSNDSPTFAPEEVKKELTKLLEYRRHKTDADRKIPNAIIHPGTQKIGEKDNISPKAVVIPEIPKSYISKQQSDRLQELKEKVDSMMSARRRAITSPVIQYATSMPYTGPDEAISGQYAYKRSMACVNPSTHSVYDTARDLVTPSLTYNYDGTSNMTPSPAHSNDRTRTMTPSPAHSNDRTRTMTPSPAHSNDRTRNMTPSPAHSVDRQRNAATPSPAEWFMEHVNYVSIYDKNVPSYSQNPPYTPRDTNTKPNNDNREYLNKFHNTFSHDSDDKPPPKKEMRPVSRVTPVVPNVQKTSQTKVIQQKKPDGSLNTFSRMSYYKNKKTDMRKSNENPHTVGSKLEGFIMNHLYQSQNSNAISQASSPKEEPKPTRTYAKQPKATNHPTLTNILQSKGAAIEQQKAETTSSPPKSTLSEKDQNDLIRLLRQQNILNKPPQNSSVGSCSTNVSPSTDSNYNTIRSDLSHAWSSSKANETKNQNAGIVTKDPSRSLLKIGNSKLLNTNKPSNTQEKSKMIVENKGQSKKIVTIPPQLPASESKDPGEWKSVMQNLLKHKTPYRGPNALDVTLKKTSYEKAYMESLRNPPNLFPDVVPTATQVIRSTKPAASSSDISAQHFENNIQPPQNMSKSAPSHPKNNAKSKKADDERIKRFMNRSHVEVTDNGKLVRIAVDARKAKPIKIETPRMAVQPPIAVPKKLHKPVIVNAPKILSEEVQRKQFSNPEPKDDTSARIPKSDYDLLDELMDDDLRKEIGELSSDEESYNMAAQDFLKDTKTNDHRVNVVYNHPLNTVADIKTVASPRQQVFKNESTQFTQKSIQSQLIKDPPVITKDTKTNDQKRVNVIYNHSLKTEASSRQQVSKNEQKQFFQKPIQSQLPKNTPVRSTTKTVQPRPHLEKTVHGAQITINHPPHIAVTPQPTPLQNVVVIGSGPVYEGYTSVQTSVQNVTNVAHNYMTIDNAPNVNLYQTQFTAPVVVSSVSVVTDPCATTVVPSNLMTTVIQPVHSYTDPHKPSQNQTSAKDIALLTPANTHVNANEIEHTAIATYPMDDDVLRKREIKTSSDTNTSKNIERKVLIEVQEKLADEKNDCKRRSHNVYKEVKAQVDKERVRKKRMAILNREINHLCGIEPIALGYTPLYSTYKEDDGVYKKAIEVCSVLSQNNLQELSEVSSPATPDSCKENKSERVQCRRILLRSSNKLKTNAPTSTSSKPMPSLDKKPKQKSASVGSQNDTPSEVDQSDPEIKNKPKRVSKRIRNKSLIVTKDTHEPTAAQSTSAPEDVKCKPDKAQSKKSVTQKVTKKNPLNSNPNKFSVNVKKLAPKQDIATDQFIDVEAEVLGTTIQKILPITLLSPEIENEEKEKSLIANKKHNESEANKASVQQGDNRSGKISTKSQEQSESSNTTSESSGMPLDDINAHIINVQPNRINADKVKIADASAAESNDNKNDKNRIDADVKSISKNIDEQSKLINYESLIIDADNKCNISGTLDKSFQEPPSIEMVKENNVDELSTCKTTTKTTENSKITQVHNQTDAFEVDDDDDIQVIENVRKLIEKEDYLVSNKIEKLQPREGNVDGSANVPKLSPKQTVKVIDDSATIKDLPNNVVVEQSSKTTQLRDPKDDDIEIIENILKSNLTQPVKIINQKRVTKDLLKGVAVEPEDDDIQIIENSPCHNLPGKIIDKNKEIKNLPKDVSNEQTNQKNAPGKREIKSLGDRIVIENLTSIDGDQTEKVIRITYANGKTFRGIVRGPVNVDTLLDDPEFHTLLNNHFQKQKKRYSFKVNVNQLSKAKGGVLATCLQEITSQAPVETVDLLSDDEEETPRMFETPHGKYKVKSMDNDTFTKHQNKLKKKCCVPLKRVDSDKVNCQYSVSKTNSKSTNKVTSPGEELIKLDDPIKPRLSPEVLEDSKILPVIPKKYVKGVFCDIENILGPVNKQTDVNNVVLIDDSSNDSVDRQNTPKPTQKIDELKNMLLRDLGVEQKVLASQSKPNEDVQVTWSTEAIDLTDDTSVTDPIADSKDFNKNDEYKNIIARKCFVKLVRCDDEVNKHKLIDTHIQTDHIELEAALSKSDDILVANDDVVPAPVSRSGSFSLLEAFPIDADIDTKINEKEHDRSSPVMVIYDVIAALSKLPTPHKTCEESVISLKCEAEWVTSKRMIHFTEEGLNYQISKQCFDPPTDIKNDVEDLLAKFDLPSQTIEVPKLTKLILNYIQNEDLVTRFLNMRILKSKSLKRKSDTCSKPDAKISKLGNGLHLNLSPTVTPDLPTIDASGMTMVENNKADITVYDTEPENKVIISDIDIIPDLSITDVSDHSDIEDMVLFENKTEQEGSKACESDNATAIAVWEIVSDCIDKAVIICSNEISKEKIFDNTEELSAAEDAELSVESDSILVDYIPVEYFDVENVKGCNSSASYLQQIDDTSKTEKEEVNVISTVTFPSIISNKHEEVGVVDELPTAERKHSTTDIEIIEQEKSLAKEVEKPVNECLNQEEEHYSETQDDCADMITSMEHTENKVSIQNIDDVQTHSVCVHEDTSDEALVDAKSNLEDCASIETSIEKTVNDVEKLSKTDYVQTNNEFLASTHEGRNSTENQLSVQSGIVSTTTPESESKTTTLNKLSYETFNNEIPVANASQIIECAEIGHSEILESKNRKRKDNEHCYKDLHITKCEDESNKEVHVDDFRNPANKYYTYEMRQLDSKIDESAENNDFEKPEDIDTKNNFNVLDNQESSEDLHTTESRENLIKEDSSYPEKCTHDDRQLDEDSTQENKLHDITSDLTQVIIVCDDPDSIIVDLDSEQIRRMLLNTQKQNENFCDSLHQNKSVKRHESIVSMSESTIEENAKSMKYVVEDESVILNNNRTQGTITSNKDSTVGDASSDSASRLLEQERILQIEENCQDTLVEIVVHDKDIIDDIAVPNVVSNILEITERKQTIYVDDSSKECLKQCTTDDVNLKPRIEMEIELDIQHIETISTESSRDSNIISMMEQESSEKSVQNLKSNVIDLTEDKKSGKINVESEPANEENEVIEAVKCSVTIRGTAPMRSSDSDFKLIIPKQTYAKSLDDEENEINRRILKRKKDMSDFKTTKRKYRKGKNIDYPKNTAAAIAATHYGKEFKQLIDYCSSVKFSFARPFHIECIDMDNILKDWSEQNCHIDEEKDSGEIENLLFIDTENTENVKITDPSQQSLIEEIENGHNVNCYEPIEINETNFNMGFGEMSGRVIQEIGNGITDLSAATLSDVKQYQPLSMSEKKQKNQNHGRESENQRVKLLHFMRHINLKEKVQSFFKKTAFDLNIDMSHNKKLDAADQRLSRFPFGLTSTDYMAVPRTDAIVNVVQIGQPPVSASAQNPVTCDPRVTHVADASPSRCSDNSPSDSQATMETEYTELTTADMTPIVQEYAQHQQSPPIQEHSSSNATDDDVDVTTRTTSIVKIELMEESSQEKAQYLYGNVFSPLPNNNVDYSFDDASNNMFNSTNISDNSSSMQKTSTSMFSNPTSVNTNFTDIFSTSNDTNSTYTNMNNNTSENIENTTASPDTKSTILYNSSDNLENISTETFCTSDSGISSAGLKNTSEIFSKSYTDMNNASNVDITTTIVNSAANVNNVNNNTPGLRHNFDTLYPNSPSTSSRHSNDIDESTKTSSNNGNDLININKNGNITSNNSRGNTDYEHNYENYNTSVENNNTDVNSIDNYVSNVNNYVTNCNNYNGPDYATNIGDYPPNVDDFDPNVNNYANNVERYPTGTENFSKNVENYHAVDNYTEVDNSTAKIDSRNTNNLTDKMLEEPQDLSVPSTQETKERRTYNEHNVQNGTSQKRDQIAHAMSAAGITSETVITSGTDELDNLIPHSAQSESFTATPNNYTKSGAPIGVMTLQQALAQVLPPPLNQTGPPENNQASTNPVAQQVLHIVQGNNAPTVINKPNGTHLIHLVRNKTPGSNGLSLVDSGLQQGGNQLIHIVNNGNPNSGQFLKRVNLLTNLANVQGSNDQKMIQFVCKSADGKSIQLNAGHQQSMVLRLHPTAVQTAPKPTETPDLRASTGAPKSGTQDSSQQEIKSRSVYEENYAQFIQSSSAPGQHSTAPIPHLTSPGQHTPSPDREKATSLPKFNQVFGKQSYQDNPNEINHASLPENADCQAEENNHNESPPESSSTPLLVRTTAPETTQTQPNLVQQIKQTISPMTMHGGVIYTRQIPVNFGGGKTINLITVPSTELVDDSPQKQAEGNFRNQEEHSSIIKLVPHHTSSPNVTVEDNNPQPGASNDANMNPQSQPVLTQMRIKLPMLSKGPHIVPGARLVRPSFFQIQRNVIAGTNQPVYQQLVLTTAPSLGQTIRLPASAQQVSQQPSPQAQSSHQAHTSQQAQPILIQTAQPAQQTQQPQSVPNQQTEPDEPESELSTLTLEQLREFDMVLEQVKERSIVNVNPLTSFPTCPKPAEMPSADSTDASATTTSVTESTQEVLYSVENDQPANVVSYVNRKSTITSATTSYVRSPDSSGIIDTPSSSTQVHITHTVTQKTTDGSSSDTPRPKKKKKKSSSSSKTLAALNNSPSKTSNLKPQEDEQTTQRILYILAEYKEQVENSPDKNKPAPRRRNQFPPTTGSKRKRSHCSSRSSCKRETSPVGGDNGEDSLITLGSEDSSCGTEFSECTECQESHSPEGKIVRRLTFEQETTTQTITQTRTHTIPQRNVIVNDGQTITVARTTTTANTKSPAPATTTLLMPANYLLPVSMIKGGQQIAIMTNRGPRLLVGAGDGNAAGALLFQRLIGPGLKPVLARPGVRHIRLPTTALHNLQGFNVQSTPVTSVQPPDSSAPPPAPAAPDPVDSRAMSSPWPDREARDKPDRGSSPDCTEPWNLPSSSIAEDYGYEEIVRTDNMERTVLDTIPDRYSPDMEAQRIFDKMFDVDSKKSMYSPRCGFDIDASDDDKPYQVVQQRKDGKSHRVTHVSTAALRHKYAILEHELRLQKSLSEECEDLGVDSPSASDLFPEADILFGAPSPAHEQTIDECNTPPPMPPSVPQPDLDDQIATDQLLTTPTENRHDRHDDLDINLDDVGEIVTVGEDGVATIQGINPEEFAKSHPNTTFHTEPEDSELPFTIAQSIKGRHITFHAANRGVVVAPQSTVISQAAVNTDAVKFTDIDNIINSIPRAQNVPSAVIKDSIAPKPLHKFDLLDTKETPTKSAVPSGHGTQVIRRLRYDERNTRVVGQRASISDETKMRNDRAMVESMGDNASSPGQPELFWDSTTERNERRFQFAENEKVAKSPFDELLNDSSAYGPHTRLDSVIKAARPERTFERTSFEGISVSGSSDESRPLRTYPPKRAHTQQTQDLERHFTLKTTTMQESERVNKTHLHEADRKKVVPRCLESEGRRRASGRGVAKRPCSCCNGSTVPPKKKSRPKKPPTDLANS